MGTLLINIAMKIAVLISGLPRFCQEFDSLINLLNDYKVDWYFYLWQKSFVDHHDAIAPNWMNIDIAWAIEKIKSNLPQHHNIADIQLADLDLLQIPDIRAQTPISRLWPMITARYEVSKLKHQIETKNNFKYDLVINGRNDIIIKNIHLDDIKNQLDQDPSLIFVDTHNRHGYIDPRINDLLLISNSKNIDIFCDLVNHVVKYSSEGTSVHSETLVATHFNKNNLTVVYKDFNINFHCAGEWRGNRYYSNFGRWS